MVLILGQVKLNKGQLRPAGLGKGLGQCPAELEPPEGARNSLKKHPLRPKLIFNNPRSIIKPGSAPDPKKVINYEFGAAEPQLSKTVLVLDYL